MLAIRTIVWPDEGSIGTVDGNEGVGDEGAE